MTVDGRPQTGGRRGTPAEGLNPAVRRTHVRGTRFARAGPALFEHEAEDDADHDEPRKRVAEDRDPDASEPPRGIALSEDAVEQRGRHAPRLVQVVGREYRSVGDPIGLSETRMRGSATSAKSASTPSWTSSSSASTVARRASAACASTGCSNSPSERLDGAPTRMPASRAGRCAPPPRLRVRAALARSGILARRCRR
jgi:hypothetical protein